MSKKKKTSPEPAESDAPEEMVFQEDPGSTEDAECARDAKESDSARIEEIGVSETQEGGEEDLEFVAEEGYGDSAISFAVEITRVTESKASEEPELSPMNAEIAHLDFGGELEVGPEAEASEVEEETAIVEGIGEDAALKSPAEIKAALECLFFTTSHPLTLQKVRSIVGRIDQKTLRGLVLQIQAEYEARGSGLQIIESAEGFQMCTRPKYAEVVLRLHRQRKKNPLSLIGLETLAIIAYKQPITRAEIEMIRGVESSGILRNLSDMGLIRVVGRKEVIGRPQLYGTTNVFLNTFGLKSIQDLPPINELRRRYSDGTLFNQATPNSVDEEPITATGESVADELSETGGGGLLPANRHIEPMPSSPWDGTTATPAAIDVEKIGSDNSADNCELALEGEESEVSSSQAGPEDDAPKP